MQKFGPVRVGAIPVAASSSGALDLPRNRFIQAIELRLRVTGNTGTSTAAADAVAGLVPQLRVVANGRDQRVAAPLWDLWEYSSLRSQLRQTNSLIDTNDQTGVLLGVCEARIDFTIDQDPRRNKLATGALLPAHMFSSLRVEADFAAAAALGTQYSNLGGQLEVFVHEVFLSQQEIAAIPRFWRYYLTSSLHTTDAAYVNFGHHLNLPVGKIIRRAVLAVTRDGARVDGDSFGSTGLYSFRARDLRRGNTDLIDATWEASVAQDRIEYGLAPSTGVTVVDFDSLGSFNAVGLSPGQAQIQANIQAPDGVSNTRILTEEIVA